MALQWGNILTAEIIFTSGAMVAFGFLKLPAFLRRKRLAKGFPWGYYTDSVPKADPGFYDANSTDFLHDIGTSFGGMEGFGEFGEFSGFGEMGEFGAHFGSGGDVGHGE